MTLNSYRTVVNVATIGDSSKFQVLSSASPERKAARSNAITTTTTTSRNNGRKKAPIKPKRPERKRLPLNRLGLASIRTRRKEKEIISARDPLATDCGCPESCVDYALDRIINGNPYSCRERIEFFMGGGSTMDQHNACLLASTQTDAACTSACHPEKCTQTQKITAENVMIIASAPKDENHAIALWTELECLTSGMDLIVLSVPEWSRSLVEEFATQARTALNLNNIQVHYHVNNNRHDVGLWCGALSEKVDVVESGTVVLLNDSVYALRPFTKILDVMQSNATLDLVGLSYSNTGGSFWIESVLRGFSSSGIDTFQNHSCESSRSTFCRQKLPVERKRCIVEHHEIALAGLYPREKVLGLFPSDPPPDFADRKTWVQNPSYWRDVLVNQMDFPVAKVNQPQMIPNTTDTLLQECTKHMNADFIRAFDYSQFETVVGSSHREPQRNIAPRARLSFLQPR